VAEEVRAMKARRKVTSKAIAERLGITEMALSRRMNGPTPFSIGELQLLARLFKCELTDLLPHLDSNQKPFGYHLAA
jgi:transcriptional regulator with XRE-family HTH domain